MGETPSLYSSFYPKNYFLSKAFFAAPIKGFFACVTKAFFYRADKRLFCLRY
jgi:hypothetical protein